MTKSLHQSGGTKLYLYCEKLPFRTPMSRVGFVPSTIIFHKYFLIAMYETARRNEFCRGSWQRNGPYPSLECPVSRSGIRHIAHWKTQYPTVPAVNQNSKRYGLFQWWILRIPRWATGYASEGYKNKNTSKKHQAYWAKYQRGNLKNKLQSSAHKRFCLATICNKVRKCAEQIRESFVLHLTQVVERPYGYVVLLIWW